MRRTLLRLAQFGRPHLSLLFLAFACMVLLGLATGAYAYVLGPALQFLLRGGAGAEAPVSGPLAWLGLSRTSSAWVFPVAILVLGLIKGVGYLGQFYFMGHFGQRLVADLRRAVFIKVSALSPAQLARERTGELLSRFSADVAAVEMAAIYTIASYVRDSLQVIILASLALHLSPLLGVAMLGVLPLALFPASRLTRTVLRRAREGQAQLGELSGQLREGLGGLKTIQSFNGQAEELSRFRTFARAHEEAVVKAAWARAAVPGVMELLAAAALAAALSYVAAARSMPAADLLSFFTAIILIYQPVKDLGRVTQFGVQAGVAGERIFALLDMPAPMEDEVNASVAPPLAKELRLEALSYAYGTRQALQGLTLSLRAGRVAALVGPSGGGKSTVASLLLRFERPQSGRILLDGVEVDRYRVQSLRAQFALVTQEPLLFSGTVLDNLLYARPEATRAEVIEAAKVAHAHGFIEALPQGYNTPIGERGVALSGGQRQRICIARAVLSKAPIWVLDEATSSLDPESEREVQAALAHLLPGRTALVIAHRLSTITDADSIHVVAAGSVVEEGTHAELLAKQGVYASLWALQRGSENRGAA